MIKVLIVEGEEAYADTLEMLVDGLGYAVSGIVDNGEEALSHFRRYPLDLVLLDINIRGSLSGVELARKMQQSRPTPIIFVTAQRDRTHFEEASDTLAAAFLLKPFAFEQLQLSVELAMKQANIRIPEGANQAREGLLADDSVFIKDRNQLIKIRLSEIQWVGVEDKYSILYCSKRKILLRQALKDLFIKVRAHGFVQVHRSALVNLKHLNHIDTALSVVQVGEHQVPLGKTYRELLMEQLPLL